MCSLISDSVHWLLLHWSLYPHHLQYGATALLLASKRGHLEVVCLLLKAGAAVFIPNKVWGVVKLYNDSHLAHNAVQDIHNAT